MVRNRLVRDERIPQALRLSVSVAGHVGTDDLLLIRHRKLRRKRFAPRFGALPSRTAPCTRLPLADIVVAQQGTRPDTPAPSRDHARAPPSSDHPA